MSKILLVAEKPAAGRDFAAALTGGSFNGQGPHRGKMADGTELDGDVVALPTTTTLHRPVKGQEKIELIDVLEDQEVAAPDAQLIQDDSIQHALRRLKPKERKIINMAFGLAGETELEPAAIADRMDMSTYGVQLLIKRAVEKMAGRV